MTKFEITDFDYLHEEDKQLLPLICEIVDCTNYTRFILSMRTEDEVSTTCLCSKCLAKLGIKIIKALR